MEAAPVLHRTLRMRVAGFIRAMTRWSSVLYLGSLLPALLWLEWRGEQQWLSSLILYLPMQALLLPALLLAPLCLLLGRPRWAALHGVAIIAVAFGYGNFRWIAPRPAGPESLCVITHNMGQGNPQQFIDFVRTQNPDVVLLQDSRRGGQDIARLYPGSFKVARGEFSCVSRHPILRSRVLSSPNWGGRPVMVRYEVGLPGGVVVLYNVHLPTPRHELNRFRQRRILRDLVGDAKTPAGLHRYHEWLAARVALARAVAEVFRTEPEPFIAAGDFNMPDHGQIYHLISANLADAHLKAGRGWGLTFPGSTHNALAFFGPWLRLDYVFASRGWEPLACAPEPGGRSQHKAVVARLRRTAP